MSNNLEVLNTAPVLTDRVGHHAELYKAAYEGPTAGGAKPTQADRVANPTKSGGSAGMENFPSASLLLGPVGDLNKLPLADLKTKPDLIIQNKPGDGKHATAEQSDFASDFFSEEKYKRRQDMIDHLSPEQKRQYEKEERILEQYRKMSDIDGIAFPADERPSLPLHDSIERLTNKSGLTDHEELQKEIHRLNPTIWDRIKKLVVGDE